MANVKFGIERLPTAHAVTAAAQDKPGSTTKVLVPALSGTDPEDASVTTVVIKALTNINGTLYYNGAAVTTGQVIQNFSSSLLAVDPNDGAVTVSLPINWRLWLTIIWLE